MAKRRLMYTMSSKMAREIAESVAKRGRTFELPEWPDGINPYIDPGRRAELLDERAAHPRPPR